MIEDKNEEIIDIKEDVDGSAIVELPESIPSPDVQETKPTDEDSDEADEKARAKEMAEGGSIDPDAEAIREAKRAKRRARKEYHKQVSAEKDTKLHLLERQNQELLERLAVVEKRTHGTEIARTDVTKQITQYVRDNKLQDKSNGRRIIADAKLKKLLNYDEKKVTEEKNLLSYFNLQRYLTVHFAKAQPASA